MTIFVTSQLIVTLDSIRNSCDVSLYVDIAGSGDPLYASDLYKCWFYGQKSSIRLIFFAKVVFYMHEEDQDQLKGAKTWNSSQKSSFCQAYLPFSQFVLKRCSNKSGQNDLAPQGSPPPTQQIKIQKQVS